ncbi:hypothetical protein ACOI1H_18200 [Loktanella sp. DJP18]|jgi:hypothetical protein
MIGFLAGALTAFLLATLTWFALQSGTVMMTERFDGPNLQLEGVNR